MLVVGIGNILLRDDGVGVHVVRALQAGPEMGPLPPGTRLVDGGTLGLDLLPMLEESGIAVLVDAVELGREPGSIAVLEGDRLAGMLDRHFSPHQVGVADLLATARLTGRLPRRVALVAIQPGEIAVGLGPTPAVRAAIPAAAEVVRDLLWELRDRAVGGRPARPARDT